MSRPRAALASALAGMLLGLSAGGGVRADPASGPLQFERAPLAEPPCDWLRIEREDLTSVAPLVWVALRPARHEFGELGVFAGGREITDRRQSSLVDVEWGALLGVFQGVSLTWGWRLSGYQMEGVEPAAARQGLGPFVGLRVHY